MLAVSPAVLIPFCCSYHLMKQNIYNLLGSNGMTCRSASRVSSFLIWFPEVTRPSITDVCSWQGLPAYYCSTVLLIKTAN